jgi:hypothetical protein
LCIGLRGEVDEADLQNSKSYAMPLTIIRWFFATLANISVTLRLDGIEFGGPINGFTGFGIGILPFLCVPLFVLFLFRPKWGFYGSLVYLVSACASPPGINAASLLQSYFIGHGQARLAVCLFDMDILRSLQKGSYTQPIFPDLTKVSGHCTSPRYSYGNFDEQKRRSPGKSAWRFLRTSFVPMCG